MRNDREVPNFGRVQRSNCVRVECQRSGETTLDFSNRASPFTDSRDSIRQSQASPLETLYRRLSYQMPKSHFLLPKKEVNNPDEWSERMSQENELANDPDEWSEAHLQNDTLSSVQTLKTLKRLSNTFYPEPVSLSQMLNLKFGLFFETFLLMRDFCKPNFYQAKPSKAYRW